MDFLDLDFSGIQFFPEREFDQKVDYRAEKREHLRGRNNVTSCRSPTRDIDTRQIKIDLKKKRHLEFLRRRSLSPELCGSQSVHPSLQAISPARTFLLKQYSLSSKSERLRSNVTNTLTSNGHSVGVSPPNNSTFDSPGSSWASLWSEQVTLMKQDNGYKKHQASTSTPVTKESTQHRTQSTERRENSINVKKTSLKTSIHSEEFYQNMSLNSGNTLHKKKLRDAGTQTESGLVTVKESDVQQLADYLQDALWREEAMKKKLAALQECTSNLVNSSKIIWTARCSEDLLRNKIKALEAQLQVCLQKFPKDGVKKLVMQMEKQKLIYEEKALVALQKATQEKTEALSKAETLQEELITSKAEAVRWQSLYEELRLSSGQVREQQQLRNEQLQQLHSQVELSKSREDELREEVMSLGQVNQELQYNICLLQENNQVLREEIKQLRDGSNENQRIIMLESLTSKEAAPQLTVRRGSQVEDQLRHTQEKLRLKERECEDLQSELQAMEQECQSSQARLSQCRDELRQLSHRRRRTTLCGSWGKVFVFFLMLLSVAGFVMLWMWHPPFREQVEDLYSDIETRLENYLMEMASPQHSGCFRPV